MELRHIRYFLAVAEERNFTRAAARLGIGQPPLSLQIRDLEAEIGVKLFHRIPQGARLTEAGQAFLDGVRTVPGQVSAAVLMARRAAGGETGRLRLGLTGTAALNPMVSASIRAFRRAFPDAELTLEEANSVVLATHLTEGRLDVAILRPSASDPAELREYIVAEEVLVAALPASHPAAAAPAVDLIALKETPLILTPRAVGISLHDATIAACRVAGFEPVPGQPAPQIASILSMVAAELGFSLVPASMRQFSVDGVTFRDLLPPVPRVALAVAHVRDGPSPMARNFTGIIRGAA